jgi:hypothetical protein
MGSTTGKHNMASPSCAGGVLFCCARFASGKRPRQASDGIGWRIVVAGGWTGKAALQDKQRQDE